MTQPVAAGSCGLLADGLYKIDIGRTVSTWFSNYNSRHPSEKLILLAQDDTLPTDLLLYVPW